MAPEQEPRDGDFARYVDELLARSAAGRAGAQAGQETPAARRGGAKAAARQRQNQSTPQRTALRNSSPWLSLAALVPAGLALGWPPALLLLLILAAGIHLWIRRQRRN